MDLLLRYMRIDLRCLQIGMAEQLLNHAYIGAVFKQVRGKGMS